MLLSNTHSPGFIEQEPSILFTNVYFFGQSLYNFTGLGYNMEVSGS